MEILYTYVVAEKIYCGGHVEPFWFSPDRKDEIEGKIPRGSEVKVRVSPSDPGISVILWEDVPRT